MEIKNKPVVHQGIQTFECVICDSTQDKKLENNDKMINDWINELEALAFMSGEILNIEELDSYFVEFPKTKRAKNNHIIMIRKFHFSIISKNENVIKGFK